MNEFLPAIEYPIELVVHDLGLFLLLIIQFPYAIAFALWSKG